MSFIWFQELGEKDISIPLADDSAEQFLYLPTTSMKKTITVEDFVEIYTIFKCKACNFTSGEKGNFCIVICIVILKETYAMFVEKTEKNIFEKH